MEAHGADGEGRSMCSHQPWAIEPCRSPPRQLSRGRVEEFRVALQALQPLQPVIRNVVVCFATIRPENLPCRSWQVFWSWK